MQLTVRHLAHNYTNMTGQELRKQLESLCKVLVQHGSDLYVDGTTKAATLLNNGWMVAIRNTDIKKSYHHSSIGGWADSRPNVVRALKERLTEVQKAALTKQKPQVTLPSAACFRPTCRDSDETW